MLQQVFSNTLDNTGVMEIGLYSVALGDGEPFGIGVALAVRQLNGKLPLVNNLRNSVLSLAARSEAVFFRRRGNKSDPHHHTNSGPTATALPHEIEKQYQPCRAQDDK